MLQNVGPKPLNLRPASRETLAEQCRKDGSKTGHHIAGRADFRNQRCKPDTAKVWKMRKVSLTPEKVRGDSTEQLRGKCGHENPENAADWP